MKTIFDKATRDELITRIQSLKADTPSQWGKMNVYQTVKHCRLWEQMIIGEYPNKRMLIGKIFGKIALKKILKDDSPMGKNTPTTPELRAAETTGDFEGERSKWIALLEGHADYKNRGFVHPFFGEMTDDQIGLMSYKHTDHHLRQFNT